MSSKLEPKLEPNELMGDDVVESLILDRVLNVVEGVSEVALRDELCTMVSRLQFRDGVHDLLRRSRLIRFQKGSEWFIKVPVEVKKTKGMTDLQMSILNAIEMSGDRGIGPQEIRSRLRLQQKDVSKALKVLVDNKSIKKVKSIDNKSTVLYMSSKIEPSEELTGGLWYGKNQEFDTLFVNKLRMKVLTYVRETRLVSAESVLQELESSGITLESLTMEHVTQLLHVLILDGLLETVTDTRSSTTRYRVSQVQPFSEQPQDALTATPCGTCPHAARCHPKGLGLIAPLTCPYLKNWLSGS